MFRDCWNILGVEYTQDKRLIKLAYFKQLKQNNPEDSPEEFQQLREAYETALLLADNKHDSKLRESAGKKSESVHDYSKKTYAVKNVGYTVNIEKKAPQKNNKIKKTRQFWDDLVFRLFRYADQFGEIKAKKRLQWILKIVSSRDLKITELFGYSSLSFIAKERPIYYLLVGELENFFSWTSRPYLLSDARASDLLKYLTVAHEVRGLPIYDIPDAIKKILERLSELVKWLVYPNRRSMGIKVKREFYRFVFLLNREFPYSNIDQFVLKYFGADSTRLRKLSIFYEVRKIMHILIVVIMGLVFISLPLVVESQSQSQSKTRAKLKPKSQSKPKSRLDGNLENLRLMQAKCYADASTKAGETVAGLRKLRQLCDYAGL